MRIQTGRLVPLGYGRYARSDEVVALEPITDGRGPGQRTLVWIRGLPEPVVASRSEGAIADDLTTPADSVNRVAELRGALQELATALDRVPAMLRRVIRDEADIDLDRLAEQARRALAHG